jgi:hypothetical protein
MNRVATKAERKSIARIDGMTMMTVLGFIVVDLL